MLINVVLAMVAVKEEVAMKTGGKRRWGVMKVVVHSHSGEPNVTCVMGGVVGGVIMSGGGCDDLVALKWKQ